MNPAKAKKISKEWYSRDDVAEFLVNYLENREVMGFSVNNAVMRPLVLQQEGDVKLLAGKLLSVHMSIDIYNDDPNINDINELQLAGWDLVIDVDCKELKYDNTTFPAWSIAKFIVQDLAEFLSRDFEERNLYIKFSGNRGFHLVIPFTSFPKEVLGYDILKYKELLYRSIIIFFQDIAYDIFYKFLEYQGIPTDLFNPRDYVDIDVQLAAPRHMIRAPYSLHDKTLLVSVIIPPEKLKIFTPLDADPSVIDKIYVPEIKNKQNPLLGDLFIYGLLYYFYHIATTDYSKRIEFLERFYKGRRKRRRKIKLPNEEELYPPCIKNLLKGLEDGRKRALFVLVNFFRIIGKSPDETLKILMEWNSRNKSPLKERMIEYAVEYHYNKAKEGRGYLPYGCERMQEEFAGMNICQKDELCSLVKNPIGYYFKKLSMYLNKENGKEKKPAV